MSDIEQFPPLPAAIVPSAEVPDDLADVLAMVLTRHVAASASVLFPWSPFRNPIPAATPMPPEIPGACYEASFGRVHVQPGCRCERRRP